MKSKFAFSIAACLAAGIASGATEGLLQGYRSAGAGPFSVTAGRAAWEKRHQPSTGGDARSCAGCHGTYLSRSGRHVKTGRPIEPMALSANTGRLSDPKKVEKWFRRNCRWTLGRVCTPQEKGDFVQLIISQ